MEAINNRRKAHGIDATATIPQPCEFASVGAVEHITDRVAEATGRLRQLTERLTRFRQLLRTGLEPEAPCNKPNGPPGGTVPSLQGLDKAVLELESAIGALGKECEQL